MDIEHIANIYRDCGFKLKKIDDAIFMASGWINYSFPAVIDLKLNKNIEKSLKWKYLITVIKTHLPQKNSYEFVLKTDNYSIDKFASKKRNDIRKSLRDCTFKRPSLDDLFQFGLKMNQQTLAKQGRSDKHLVDDQSWRKYITTFYEQENIFILGAYIAERMVGYITVCKINGNYYITDPFYDFDTAASSPIQGLIFTLVNQIIEREGRITIFYGIESFKPLPQLNRYKSSMHFERIPTTRAYIIHPLVLPILKFVYFFYSKILRGKKTKNPLIQQIVQLLRGNKILNTAINQN